MDFIQDWCFSVRDDKKNIVYCLFFFFHFILEFICLKVCSRELNTASASLQMNKGSEWAFQMQGESWCRKWLQQQGHPADAHPRSREDKREEQECLGEETSVVFVMWIVPPVPVSSSPCPHIPPIPSQKRLVSPPASRLPLSGSRRRDLKECGVLLGVSPRPAL